MAGILCCAQVAAVSLGAATAKTVVQLVAPANQRLKLRGIGIYPKGTSSTEAAYKVRILRQTSAGTMSALTPTRISAGSETLQATAQHTATVEPSESDVIDLVGSHPQGPYEKLYPPDLAPEIPGGTRLGIEITAPAALTVDCKAIYEE